MSKPNFSSEGKTNDSLTQDLNNNREEEEVQAMLPSFPNYVVRNKQFLSATDGRRFQYGQTSSMRSCGQQPPRGARLSPESRRENESSITGTFASKTSVVGAISSSENLAPDIDPTKRAIPPEKSGARSATPSTIEGKPIISNDVSVSLASQARAVSLLKSFLPDRQAAAASLLQNAIISQKLHPDSLDATGSPLSRIVSCPARHHPDILPSTQVGLGYESAIPSLYGAQNSMLHTGVDAATALLLRQYEQQRAIRLHQLSEMNASAPSINPEALGDLCSDQLSPFLRFQRNVPIPVGSASTAARENNNALLSALDCAASHQLPLISAASSVANSASRQVIGPSIDSDLHSLKRAAETTAGEPDGMKEGENRQDHRSMDNSIEEEETMSDDESDCEGNKRKGGVAEPFPRKLHRMLLELEAERKDDIISFFPHGLAFAIHKPRNFIAEVMPRYFRMSRLSSFQRQLNLYAFKRITEGQDKGGYYHELFVKEKPHLCKRLKRTKPKKKQTLLPVPWNSNPAVLGSLQYSGAFPSLATSLAIDSNLLMLPSLTTQQLLERELLKSRLLAANNAFGEAPTMGGLGLHSSSRHVENAAIHDLLLRATSSIAPSNNTPNPSSTSMASTLPPSVVLALLEQQQRQRNNDGPECRESTSEGTASTQANDHDKDEILAAARQELSSSTSQNFPTPKTQDYVNRSFPP